MNSASGPALIGASHEALAKQGSTPSTNQLTGAAKPLCAHIYSKHENGDMLAGPDPGVRFNARIFAAALSGATAMKWGDDRELPARAFLSVLSKHQTEGLSPYSLRSYPVLSDRRSYLRQSSMLLNHLLPEVRRRRAR